MDSKAEQVEAEVQVGRVEAGAGTVIGVVGTEVGVEVEVEAEVGVESEVGVEAVREEAEVGVEEEVGVEAMELEAEVEPVGEEMAGGMGEGKLLELDTQSVGLRPTNIWSLFRVSK